MKTYTTNDIISYSLNQHNKALAKFFDADVIMFKSPLLIGVDDVVRNYIEFINEMDKPKNKLTVLLETEGGSIEVVERIYSVFRKHYKEINFIIPNYAYSAGTVLALSGDEIYMDYYSVLGPIDPQLEGDDGKLVPGLGYLLKFNELVEKINNGNGENKKAELAYLLRKFDPAKLFHIEQARNHSKTLLKQWLPIHKFKDWNKTETSEREVTHEMKMERAGKIAETLSNPEKWHSHGRGIGIIDLQSDDLKLKIENFGNNKELNKKIMEYYNLVIDYCNKMGINYFLHGKKGLEGL